MSKSSENVKRWRITTKDRMIAALGGKCVCCGYNKCQWALEFHHLNKNEKLFTMGGVRGSSIAWHRIVEELRKCVLVCSICHREIEHGMRALPDDYPRFDEAYTTYKLSDGPVKECLVCKKLFSVSKTQRYYCSEACHENRLQTAETISCAYCDIKYVPYSKTSKFCRPECLWASRRTVGKPTSEILIQEIKTLGIETVAKKYGVANGTVRNWRTKLYSLGSRTK